MKDSRDEDLSLSLFLSSLQFYSKQRLGFKLKYLYCRV